MSKIFISGGTGFIGKSLLEILVKERHEVFAYTINNFDEINILRKMGIKHILFENDLEKNNYKIDACIHLASYGVKYSDNDLSKMIDVNIKLSSKIMRFCENSGCKVFISAGSCFEYGTQNVDKLTEDCPLKPEDSYASSKVAANIILSTMANKSKIKFLICRPFGVFGINEPSTRLLPLIYNAGKNGVSIKLSEGNQVRDYLYVKDVANGFYQVLLSSNNFENGESINICSGIPCKINEFVKNIITLMSFDPVLFKFGALEYRKNESMRFVGSNEKIISKTNWRPMYTVTEGLLEYFNFMEKQNDNN